MPSKGYRSISLDAELLDGAEEMMNRWNDRVQWKAYRSLSHFVESALVRFVDDLDKFLDENPEIKRSAIKQGNPLNILPKEG